MAKLQNPYFLFILSITILVTSASAVYADHIGAGNDDGITATASSTDDTAIAQNTVNGVGLTGDVHSTEWAHTWTSNGMTTAPSPNPARGTGHWLHYDLGQVYQLTLMHIWNANEVIGRGLNSVTIDYSIDGSTWNELGTYNWPQALGSGYTGFDGPNFGGATAQYVLITANSNHGDSWGYALSEIKINISTGPPDEDPPTPNPPTWASPPAADGPWAITMTATTGTDPSGVQYYFEETTGQGNSSGWQSSSSYTDQFLNSETQYSYRIRMRDLSPQLNVTGWSTPPASAITDEIPTGECPDGDLDDDCDCDVNDLLIFVGQWLDPPGCISHPNDCADLDEQDGVNGVDFVILAADWMEVGAPVVLVINEMMASNSTTIADEHGEYDDWIEIFNPGLTAVLMSGMFLEDNDGFRWEIPPGIGINSGEYLLFWADDGWPTQGSLHTNFKLSKDGDGVTLYDTDGTTVIDTKRFSSMDSDVSFGCYPDATDNWYNMSDPTPELTNSIGMAGRVYFSRPSGIFTSGFSLSLTTESPEATIRYTTNGSKPTESVGQLYIGPISVTNSIVIRAGAFQPDYAPGPVKTNTYISLNDAINQPEYPAGFPTLWHEGYPVNYLMHPDVVDHPTYSDIMDDALLSIPSMSIVMDMDDLFDQETGIYPNSEERGVAWERPTSVELIYPDGSDGFDIDCGIRIYGDGSAIPEVNLKHTFRLLFKGMYGSTKLDYPLFEDSPVSRFDTIILRGGSNFSWAHRMDHLEWQRQDAQYIRDIWARDTQLAMGHPASHSNYVHLYLNGLYWGLYNPSERPSAPFLADHIGGDKEDWDVLNSGYVVDGTRDSWNAMMDIANSDLSIQANYEAIQEYLDVENLIDYVILQHYLQNGDWAGSNWYVGRIREPGAWYKFFIWDAEYSIYDIYKDDTWKNHPDSPQQLFQELRDNAEFRVLFGDHVHRHLFNDGVLTAGSSQTRYLKRVNQTYDAIVAESARWGDNWMTLHGNTPYKRDEDWIPAKNWIINQFFVLRPDVVIDQYRNIDLYPNVAAPVFYINGDYQHGGYITPGDSLTMTAPAGTIYYTVDGNDPYLPPFAINSLTILEEDASKAVLIPTVSNPSGTAWRTDPGFDDSSWTEYTLISDKTGGVGYERSSGYEDHISYDVESEMYNTDTSCYIRIPFTVTAQNLIDFDQMTLKTRYDDGFIAYINGAEVVRANFTGTPQWNSSSDDVGSESSSFAVFDISDSMAILNTGSNILAIHGLNAGTDSSDFLISPKLVLSTTIGGGPSSSAIEYTGVISLTQSCHVKSRTLDGTEWSALNEATFVVGDVSNLRITEIMYHPKEYGSPDDPNAEFIELKNIGGSSINLNLVTFTDGIDYTFGDVTLGADSYIVLAKDTAVFDTKYPTFVGTRVGPYTGRINNAGERITLEDALGTEILNFNFKDGWYQITDGEDFSLNIIDDTNEPNTWEYGEYWIPSSVAKGTPGAADSGHVAQPGDIVINELLAHSNGNPYSYDWIELHNTTNSSIDIGGWFLSDDNDELTSQYVIPSPHIIPPDGYVVFRQDLHFGGEFGLSEHGETLYLCSGDGLNLSGGFCTEEDFDASEADVTFGRYTKSAAAGYDVDFVPMASPTYGTANGNPKVTVVISEMMYHPDTANPLNSYAEYVELYNTSGDTVSLYDPAHPENTWLLVDEDEGIEFYLPTGVTIGGFSRILLVKNLAAFTAEFGTPSVPAYEWLEGRLSNAGEKINLMKPGEPELDGFVPYYRVDRVNYSDGAHPENFRELGFTDPWPSAADGDGDSLYKTNLSGYGNDVENWASGTPTPGS